MPLEMKNLVLGLVLLLCAQLALAQNNLGELLDAGAKKISADEFKQDIAQHTLVGPAPSGDMRIELMYAVSGVVQGSYRALPGSLAGGGYFPGAGAGYGSIDGAWTIDDSGRTCTSMAIGKIILPFRCQYWFKLKDDYFVADSDTDPKAKVLRRTVKQ